MLKNKTVVITGCNRGIGKSILELFAKNGANIWACVRKPNEEFTNFIKKVSSENNVTITPIYFDLKDIEQVKNGAKEIVSKKLPIDIIINNSGDIHTSHFLMTPLDKIKETFDINFFSQLLFNQYLIKTMLRHKKGSIVNISSTTAIDCNEGRSAYASSKAALLAFSKVLAKELSAYNIRVNVIAPGLIDTDMTTRSTKKEVVDNMLKGNSIKRLGKPNEIAAVALFLSSDLSSYITGQVIRADGGM